MVILADHEPPESSCLTSQHWSYRDVPQHPQKAQDILYECCDLYTHVSAVSTEPSPSSLLILCILKCISGGKYPWEGKINPKLITSPKPLPDRMPMNNRPWMPPSQQGKDALPRQLTSGYFPAQYHSPENSQMS